MSKIVILILMLMLAGPARSAALPAYSGKVNNAVGSIIESKLQTIQPNFAANDPRFAATVSAVQSGVTASAMTLVAGGAAVSVGAISWPALLLSAGVSFVANAALSVGVDGLIKWLWGDSTHPNQTQLSGTGLGTADLHQFGIIPSSWPSILDTYGGGADIWFSSDNTYAKARHIKTVSVVCPNSSSPFCSGGSASSSNMDAAFANQYSGSAPYWVNAYRRVVSSTTSPATTTNQIVFDYTLPSGQTLLPPSYQPHWQSAGQSINDLPASYVSQPLSDEQLAALVNTVWRLASQNQPSPAPDPSTAPYPYPSSTPITPGDVAGWRANYPQLAPTVSDFISPVAPPGVSNVPVPNPGTDAPPVLPPGVNPASTTQVTANIDWGTFQPPSDGDTPTADMILSPLFNLWPQWSSFSFPPHSSVCPTPSAQLWGQTITFHQVCDWAEKVRAALQAVFAVAWAVVVVFIVMGA